MRDIKNLKIAKFVRRLYKLVSDDSYPEIQWTEDGKSFFISDKNLFLKSELKTLSKTSEYSAFVRQLYIYGFSKSKSIGAVEEEYYHRNFQKEGEQMLPCIKRIVDKNTSLIHQDNFKKSPTQLKDLLQYLSSKNYKLENDVKSLQERVDKQECTINGLVEIISRMFRVNGEPNFSRTNYNNYNNDKINGNLNDTYNDINDTYLNGNINDINDTYLNNNNITNIINDNNNNIINDNNTNIINNNNIINDNNTNIINNNIIHENWELQNYLQNHQLMKKQEKSNFLYSSDKEDSFYKTDIF